MTKPAKRSALLTHGGRLLTITDEKEVKTYVVDKLPKSEDMPFEAFALTKRDNTVYHVKKDQFGLHCDCKGGTYRTKKCRHVLALIVVGLIGANHGYHDSQEEAEEARGQGS